MFVNSPESEPESEFEELHITVQNVGGITDGELTLSPGVTLLSGENASNKSSFLRGLAAVLGGPTPPIKSDADRGRVTLRTDENEYFLELSNENGDPTVTDAERFSDRTDLCELFAALGETNPIRQCLLTDGDVYELLMRPVDTAEIEAEIEQLKARKDRLDERLAELDRSEDRLPTLRTRATTLREDREEIETALREKREEIDEREAETDGNDVLDDLKEKRSERESVRNRIETQREAIRSLEDELEAVREQRDEPGTAESARDVDAVESEIEGLHHQKQQLTSTINALSPIVEMNDQLLDDEREIPEEMKSDEIVAELDPSSRTISCWTCGSTVEREEIAEQVRVVQEIIGEKRQQRETITERVRSLEEEKRQLERRRDERERLAEKERSVEAEIEQREETLSELRDEKAALDDEIESLQADAETLDERDDELLELHGEVSDLEYERGQLENELTELEREIEELEAELKNRDDLEAERESVATRLREQRERIETLERDLVTTFNESMQQVLDVLDYENVERVWIERLAGDSDAPSSTDFELHIVRSSESGAAYEDTVDSLSKSEREVIGLDVAFAGYLVHDVASELPFIVIDAVEMLDADRIRGLLNYFEDHTEYVVAAVLPEEARELEETYPTVSTASFAARS
ncbi:Chromosome segregation ATPase-like protein (plasmid) [Haloterrigena turkmenica DSM 5511]|uniref:Chromosome segregation ATPase-like protein n=1 Tax=Haloterrigena turkmenica (strain ATCC 51198 / DSM 5511 / JCM 9101 / NCIMB 13204 / VKM B-1734 / 4k) TaxID=543526 RepID=D2S294_HALTV|nr:archaea-specific SMC-related protein [Haloterrigena turkmenica]ADB63491.1 Chromosome segregation ATPase-like protein [Haloterrigena turkmenica DSM 5511]